PVPVADLMVELANPGPGEKVYDPCFGFGGLLVRIARRIQAAAQTDSLAAWGDMQRTGLFGVERDRVSYAIGLCRVLLAGIESPGLALGNALDRALPDSRLSDGFDCVLAVPPWGRKTPHAYRGEPGSTEKTSGGSHGQFVIPSRDTENLFLQHVMANLCPGGRAVVALTDSRLYRSGADRQVRKALLSSYCVDAVVSLPAGAFAPYTNLQASLLLFRYHEPCPNVRFVKISPTAWERVSADGSGNRRRGDLLRSLAALIRRHELTNGTVPQDVEAWDVAVQDLAGRDYELVAKQTGGQALQAELERIVAADASMRIERLDDVAEVHKGLRYERRFTTGTRSAPSNVPGLLRVGDIRDTGIGTPSLYLNGEGKVRPKEDDVLRAGDVVITTSGVVGRVGLISDVGGGVGSLATGNMAIVRARQGLTPHFVAALLRSPTYQNWLSGHARGAIVRHLSIRTLRSVPIPVPPVPVQDRVIGELDGPRGDGLAALARLLGGTATTPLAVWLETPFVARLAAGRPGEESDRIGALSAAAEALLSLVAQSGRGTELASPEASDQRIGTWLEAAHQAASALDGVASIPRGAGRLAVIEVARLRLNEAQHTLDAAEGATVKRLRSFTRAVMRLAEEEVRAMQESVTVGVSVEPAHVVVGIESEVRLRLTNSSAVPLRDLVVETRPAVGNGRIAYLSEGATCDVPLTVRAHDATRALRMVVSWQAHRLDGTAVENEQAIELHVRSTREAVRSGDLGASPYIVGSPVDRQEMFFGRADVIERIQRQVGASTHANVILLEGNRRTGKTSILRQLGNPDALPGWITVDCSLQDAEGEGQKGGISTRNFYRLLARRTGWSLYDAGVETWFPQLPDRTPDRPFKLSFLRALDRAFADEHPFETFEVYMAAAIQAASPRRVLLMLDEFDKLQEGIEAGVTSPQAPENIRHLLQN
ncbi:MAG: N-6 DNA methylase, partial [Acidobacteria bacterium]|nr:N-6 DNA methylase [Acidobacteriota bacterium]